MRLALLPFIVLCLLILVWEYQTQQRRKDVKTRQEFERERELR